MSYVITEACIKCKYTACVDVCPVDCFYQGENMLVINPDECIDCGVCEPECYAEAILPDYHPEGAKWVSLNLEYSQKWPNITLRRSPLPNADSFKGQTGKYKNYFSPKPGV